VKIIISNFYHLLIKLVEKFIFFLCKKKFYKTSFLISLILEKIYLRKISNEKNYNSIHELLLKIKRFNFKKKYKINNYFFFKKKIKILFLCPSHKNFRSLFVDTAKYCGIKTDIFFTDHISYIDVKSENNQKIKIAETVILKKIIKFKPNFIFMDCNYMGNKNTINNDFVNLIKKKFKIKAIGWMGDIYSIEAFKIMNYWSSSLNYVFYGEPNAHKIVKNSFKINNTHYLPFFVNDKKFKIKKKKYDFFFSGMGNVVRYTYLTFLEYILPKSNLKYIFFFYSQRQYLNNLFKFSEKKYIFYLSSSRVVLNLSARTAPGVRVLAGRSIEAIASQCLLIEEQNQSIEKMFIPYKHFIPFNSVKELSIILKFIKLYPDLVELISREAFYYYSNKYRSDIGWKKIIDKCQI